MGATAALGWQFVHISDPKTARDPATRRFVRATVAANYHRKEREHHSLAHGINDGDTDKAEKATKKLKKKQKLSPGLVHAKEASVDECSSPSPPALYVPGLVEPTENADEDNIGYTQCPHSVSSLPAFTNALTSGHEDPWGIRFTGVEYQPDYGSLLQYCRRPYTVIYVLQHASDFAVRLRTCDVAQEIFIVATASTRIASQDVARSTADLLSLC